MAAPLASPLETPRQSEPALDWKGPMHRDSEHLSSAIAAAVEALHGMESRREATLRERETRWACEWWPPDKHAGHE